MGTLERPSLVDAHCHGVLPGELGLGSFETHLAAAGGHAAPATPGTTFFDSRTGFAIRRWCPPLLGMEPHCPPARYLAGRRELGAYEAGRRLLRGTGIVTYLVDTGLSGELTSPKELAAAGDASALEIVRLEPLAQQVADTSGTVDGFLGNLAEAVHAAARTAVGFVTFRAFGPGFTADPPGQPEVRRAAGAWLADRTAGGPLTDPVLLRHLLWQAVATGLPLQIGTADPGPGPLTDFLNSTAGLGTDVVLLRGCPDHRRAAQLAGAFPHVYTRVGAALTGPVLAEVLELAPFGKVLYSSGAAALPELHVVGARLFMEALHRIIGSRVGDGAWSPPDAQRVTEMISAGNARRVYGLSDPGRNG